MFHLLTHNLSHTYDAAGTDRNARVLPFQEINLLSAETIPMEVSYEMRS